MNGHEYPVAVLGDVIRSRTYGPGPELLHQLAEQLDWVNSTVSAYQPLQITIGDELQGIYPDVPTALIATLLLRLKAYPVSIRFGIGVGAVVQTMTNQRPFGQTGEGWWFAREALEHVERHERPRRTSELRTWVMSADGAMDAHMNAFLLMRDALIARMPRMTQEILLRSLLGQSRAEIASDLGVLPPAISKRISTHGLKAIIEAHALLRGTQ